MKLYLASASPRRRELLLQIGINCPQYVCDIDEAPLLNESPQDYVQRLAISKAKVAVEAIEESPVCVIGSDTSVISNQKILGKPEDKSDASRMLKQLSSQTHQVLSAVAVAVFDRELKLYVDTSISQVTFGELNYLDIEEYIQTGEPFGKAGGYAIQGVAAKFIKNISGSYSGVMGLPLYETSILLKKAGVL